MLFWAMYLLAGVTITLLACAIAEWDGRLPHQEVRANILLAAWFSLAVLAWPAFSIVVITGTVLDMRASRTKDDKTPDATT